MRITPYIEIIGVAGSGKTTAAQLLLESLQKRGTQASLRETFGNKPILKLHLLLRTILFLARFPFLITVYFVQVKKEFSSTAHVKKTVNDLVKRLVVEAVAVRYLLSKSNGVLINDEGLVGKIVALQTLTRIKDEQVERIVRSLMPVPATLVFVSASAEEAMEREAKRDVQLSFFNDMSTDTKTRFYKENSALFELFIQNNQGFDGIEVLRVDNLGSVDALKEEIEGVI